MIINTVQVTMINSNEIISSLKPFYREIRFRLSRNKADTIERREVDGISEQWKSIVDSSEEILQKERNNKHILFVSGYGLGSHYLAVEPIIMMSLVARGCRITSLYCNKSLPCCEFNISGNNKPRVIGEFRHGISDNAIEYRCHKCKNNLEQLYGNLPVILTGLERYLSAEDYESAGRVAQAVQFEHFRTFTYNDIAVGEEAFASILRATFMGEVQDSRPNRFLVARYIMSGILTTIAYEKAFLDIKPDRIVCIHGVYQTHGIAIKVAIKLGIPSIVMGGGGIRKSTLVLCHNETYHHQLVNESNDIWTQFVLTRDEKTKTMDYAVKRRDSGAGVDYLSYHHNALEDVSEIYRRCKIDSSRKIVTIYTNVIWDAQIFYNGNAFRDIFDWIVTSIEELSANKNVWVVIRIHPAEAQDKIPPKQPMLRELTKRFPVLPENIRIIPPESDISSYVLAQESVANIIYGTKMGLEIALMKRPLIVCGETFSRNKGYGIDITSKKQYRELLANIEKIDFDVDKAFDTALQYAHYYYFRRMLDIPFSTGLGNGKQILIDKISDLVDGNFPGIDVICNGIIDLKPFYIGAK